MRFKYQKVVLSKIDLEDASFRITAGDASPILKKSIASTGLFNPPALFAKKNRYCIVSGFARIRACRELGVSSIYARIIEPDTPLKRCVQLAVIENSFQRELNPVSLARAVQLISDVCSGTEEVVALAQNMGLAVNHQMLKKLSIVNQMQDSLNNALASATVALPVALQLHKIKEKKAVDEICRLFGELHLSLNRQRALLEWIVAISKRDKISVEDLLNEKPLQKLRQNSELDRRQKSNHIRQYFQKRRWPSISAFEKRYNALVKKLKLKKGARLLAPANFESATYSIQIDFQNIREIKEMEQEIQRLARSPYMANLLEQIKL